MTRSSKCELCNERKIAALVELDGKNTYCCRVCTESIQEQHPTEALCDVCNENPTVVTLAIDGKPLTCCASCAKSYESKTKKKKDKKSKKAAAAGFGIGSQQGRRPTMEDAEIAVTSLADEFGDYVTGTSEFYGVYDGHGGQRAAEFIKNTLHHKIVASEQFKEGKIEEAIRDGYLAADNELLKLCDAENWPDGSTGVVALLHEGKLWTSCVGDSELVVSINGEAKCTSFKHKPTEPGEKARIQAAGGVVLFDRLGASMAVSRSFGDKVHKHPFNGAPADHMSADPFIDCMDLEGIEFIIVACDGLWDHFGYQDAVDYIGKRRRKGKSPQEVAESIVQESLDRGSTDNVTCIVIYR